MACFGNASEWARRPKDLPRVRRLGNVLLGDPQAFEVLSADNPHMRDESGHLRRVDHGEARREWEALRLAYESIGSEVSVLPGDPKLPDLCFTANPSLILPLPSGGTEAWMARMAHDSRAGEVAHHRRFAESQHFTVREMPAEITRFEGCGDGLLHPGRFLLHGGVGPRTEEGAWRALAAAHSDLDVLLYRLVDPRFYHLDTALAPLTEDCALAVPGAFEISGLELLRAAYSDLIEIDEEEALRFAGNAHSPNGRHVLIQAGCERTTLALVERGFEVIPVETGEFLKSGGSVFCLKQSY